MKQAAAKTTSSVSGDPHLGIGSVTLAFLDTTWRIATPVVLWTVLGIYADLHLHTKPWLTMLCVPIGFVCGVLLVKRQLQAAAKMEDKE